MAAAAAAEAGIPMTSVVPCEHEQHGLIMAVIWP